MPLSNTSYAACHILDEGSQLTVQHPCSYISSCIIMVFSDVQLCRWLQANMSQSVLLVTETSLELYVLSYKHHTPGYCKKILDHNRMFTMVLDPQEYYCNLYIRYYEYLSTYQVYVYKLLAFRHYYSSEQLRPVFYNIQRSTDSFNILSSQLYSCS